MKSLKMGEKRILELREFAEKSLGNIFNLPDFHNQVLKNGTVPLETLKVNIENWVKEPYQSKLEDLNESLQRLTKIISTANFSANSNSSKLQGLKETVVGLQDSVAKIDAYTTRRALRKTKSKNNNISETTHDTTEEME